MDTLQTSPFLLDMSHSSVLEEVREAFDSNSVETLEDINLRLLNQVNSLPSLSSRELSLRGREDSLGIFLLILGKGREERGRGESLT